MYEYIRGELTEVAPTYAIVEAAGVGYHLQISLHTFSQIETLAQVKLYVHFIVREDVQLFYGFVSKSERELFRLLLSVSGVGGNTARMILSSYTVEELRGIISTGNAATLKSVKGLGLKTAQKIIVEIGGKMATFGSGEPLSEEQSMQSITSDEAVEALVMLGFVKSASQKVVKAIVTESPMSSTEEIIRQALKRL